MRYYQLGGSGESRLAVRTADGLYDLTAANPDVGSYLDLVRTGSIAGMDTDTIADGLLTRAPSIDTDAVRGHLETPLAPGEVWAAGVTYQISEEARRDESDMEEMYIDVYDADRPEVFFKATPSRIVGPNDAVGIRHDSSWDVPEPELGIVLYRGDIVGFTVGNDMSSRAIEGENPLYLPQAKVYDRCCSLGPCVRSAESIDDPQDLEMWMTIERDGEVMFDESTNTGQMVRSLDELVDCYVDHNAIPELSVLLTGTSLVPDETFTLREGDRIDIGIEEIGSMSNPVTTV